MKNFLQRREPHHQVATSSRANRTPPKAIESSVDTIGCPISDEIPTIPIIVGLAQPAPFEGDSLRLVSGRDKLEEVPIGHGQAILCSQTKRSIQRSIAESNSRGDIVERFKRYTVPVGSSQAPMCRPWDRGDLLKRLATFKSMTWFGKPKVVSAVNCARRGWINVEMDIIACEACGARLLFSTPSSWTQQQVEKAAAVFSLRLDNGHKLLCPWIDNACDETLAHFPPTPAPVLVDGYRERSSALLRLSALPVISSSAIDYMRSPHLEHFLEHFSMLECGLGSAYTSKTECLGNECEAVSANLYHQAQKLISLCGWELRSLPYMVDCKDQLTQSAKDAHLSDSSRRTANGPNPGIIVYSLSGADEAIEVDAAPLTSGEHQSDPDSVVLDCRLCGASVGLWAFSTVPRPLELFRLVGSSEVNGKENRLDSRGGIDDSGCNGATSSKEPPLSLNLTIAGGPPPTKQNFRATVSLPIISRHLRVGFSSDSDNRNRMFNNMSCVNSENIQFGSQNKQSFQQEKDHNSDALIGQIVQPDDMATSKFKRNVEGLCVSSSDDPSSCLNQDFVEIGDTPRIGNDDAPLKGRYSSGQGLPSVHAIGTWIENPMENMQTMSKDPGQNGTLTGDAENAGIVNAATGVDISSQARESLMTTPDANDIIRNEDISKNNSLMMVAADTCHLQQEEGLWGTDVIHNNVIVQASSHESSFVTSCLQDNAPADNALIIDSQKGDNGSNFRNCLGPCVNNQKIEGMKDRVQTSVNSEAVAVRGSGKDLKRDQAMELDPIRQHRHFCPWIISTGSAAPGWQLTLSALHNLKEFCHPLLEDSPSSPMFEVDDPIASIRKLFMSPSAKRMKPTHGSS
ncbi:hypothetical protein HHK36_024335 [Tetracentron sinense]|uniref:C3HC-type domain-containing protein n=1 Tax=Tetracentron sinense TaxID=13715 RepID=A0A834YMN0_TETSI|nr:hypothetical protein HHK36_024335 [Tetracentron sinense]